MTPRWQPDWFFFESGRETGKLYRYHTKRRLGGTAAVGRRLAGDLGLFWSLWAKNRLTRTADVPLFQTVTDLRAQADALQRRAYGVIEVVDGRFCRVVLRPVPKIISAPEIMLFGGWYHRRRSGDRLRLYYNQPRRFRSFLALKYVVSARQTTVRTVTCALAILDEIARLKHSDALLCDVGNWRISTKLLARWGWQPHSPSRWHRHYIKRFYGEYPAAPTWLSTAAEPRQRRLPVALNA